MLVERIERDGWTIRAAAESAGISERTARKWLSRWRGEGELGLIDRSSAPNLVANRTDERTVAVIAALRRLRLTGPEIAETLDRPLSTVSGIPEADALVAVLEEVELPRPGPYHFAQALLRSAGSALREVRVSRVADHTFYATAVLADGSEVDARPRDAITLALVNAAPIAVARDVLDESARFHERRPELAGEVTGEGDGASVLADEVRARLTAMRRALAELNDPSSRRRA